MGDADIIPIGTGGRPGRGTGTRPSAAARGLAPESSRKRATKPPSDVEGSVVEPSVDEPISADAPEAGDARTAEPPATDAPAAAVRPDDQLPLQVADREPSGGIPVSDWLAAFQGASREMFGT